MSYLITLNSNKYYDTRYIELFNHLKLIDIITPDIMSYLITLKSHILILIFFRRYNISLHYDHYVSLHSALIWPYYIIIIMSYYIMPIIT